MQQLKTGVDESDLHCPICKADTSRLASLKGKDLADLLGRHFRDPHCDLDICDYTLEKCTQCTLEFADPLEPGSNAFYHWVTSQTGYYPTRRWEWDLVLDAISTKDAPKILEVGSGAGSFLDIVKEALPASERVGIDTTVSAVEESRTRGHETFCGFVEEFASRDSRKFDFVLSFHCLEHVPNPVGFVKALLRTLREDGKLFLSTPYSPLSFETSWFDPLNHPPHHMTRWNVKAYEALARSAGAEVIETRTSAASSVFSRAITARALADGYCHEKHSTQQLNSMRHPIRLAQEMYRQSKRDEINGSTVGDIILVQMRKAASAVRQSR